MNLQGFVTTTGKFGGGLSKRITPAAGFEPALGRPGNFLGSWIAAAGPGAERPAGAERQAGGWSAPGRQLVPGSETRPAAGAWISARHPPLANSVTA